MRAATVRRPNQIVVRCSEPASFHRITRCTRVSDQPGQPRRPPGRATEAWISPPVSPNSASIKAKPTVRTPRGKRQRRRACDTLWGRLGYWARPCRPVSPSAPATQRNHRHGAAPARWAALSRSGAPARSTVRNSLKRSPSRPSTASSTPDGRQTAMAPRKPSASPCWAEGVRAPTARPPWKIARLPTFESGEPCRVGATSVVHTPQEATVSLLPRQQHQHGSWSMSGLLSICKPSVQLPGRPLSTPECHIRQTGMRHQRRGERLKHAVSAKPAVTLKANARSSRQDHRST